jgi:endonuclease/exonuclease/phosphatase (EEP) superfamily protein YafD
MLKVGKKVANRTLPTVVAGDINDVVWSYTDALTGTKELLHDVRVGRGFYNSFNARNWFMRWPLDHVFVTQEFKLKKIERLEKVGSDHFPIYVELVL